MCRSARALVACKVLEDTQEVLTRRISRTTSLQVTYPALNRAQLSLPRRAAVMTIAMMPLPLARLTSLSQMLTAGLVCTWHPREVVESNST